MIGRSGFDTVMVAGSARQMAPELMPIDVDDDAPRVTKESDVYAFSMVALEVRDLLFRLSIFFGNPQRSRRLCPCCLFWPCHNILSYPLLIYFINFVQILTGKQPFPTLNSDFRVVMHVQAGKRPERSSYLPATFTDSMWKLLVDCWDQDPENRPDMGTVIRRLEYM